MSSKPAILLVDDDGAERRAVTSTLEDAVFEVLSTESALDASNVLDSLAHLDLLVTKIHMCGKLHGMALARMARTRRRALPVVYLDNDLPDVERQLALGPILSTPFDPSALLRAVTTVLPDKMPHRPGTTNGW